MLQTTKVRSTKIIATIGPATNSVDMMKKMIQAGMDAARFNFSHGSKESHEEMMNNMKTARKELNKPVPLILDTKGPEIRTGRLENDESAILEKNEKFILTTEDLLGDSKMASVSYATLPEELFVGAKILIDDGSIELEVEKIEGTKIYCRIIEGGILRSNKGVNLPSISIKLPAMTEKDKEDMLFGIQHGYEFVAASFIQGAEDVKAIREFLDVHGGNDIKIISKIENRAGLSNIYEILAVSDGVMVARGDLGVEIPPEEVPLAQKRIIHAANTMGKMVITATQMLESMTVNPQPTRAEASDVANAVYDGSDGIMLSGETAMGTYPIKSIEMMSKIAKQAEMDEEYYVKRFHTGQEYHFTKHEYDPIAVTNTISYATCLTAEEIGAKCIVTLTTSGFTARNIAKFKPACPIIAITAKETFWHQLNLAWGCQPVLFDFFNKIDVTNVNEIFDTVEYFAKKTAGLEDKDIFLVVAGLPIGLAGTTNIMRIQVCGGDGTLSHSVMRMEDE